MIVSVKKLVKLSIPTLPYEHIAQHILNGEYELSIVFVGSQRMRTLNRTYRNKDADTNVLAFPLTDTSGEIVINPSRTKGFSVLHLLIHGMLHLKGHRHGSTMEKSEQELLKIFSHDKTHRDRYRRGDAHSAGPCC